MTSLIDRYFRKKTSSKAADLESTTVDTSSSPSDPIVEQSSTSGASPKLPLDIPQLFVGVAQSVGIQRDHNEDALVTLTINLTSGDKNLHLGLFIIADGMGGHENGEIASQIAVEKLSSHVISSFIQPVFSTSGLPDLSVQEILRQGVLNAHQSIRKEVLGGGSTLTAALIFGDQMTIAHVGDSRAYIYSPGGGLQLLTHDHSLVKRLEEIGQISPEQVSNHPQRNVLYRALGQADPLDPDIATYHLVEGTRIILCTDGLWGVISENEMTDIVHLTSQPQQLCQELVNLANAAGGPDNISVILIDIPE